PPRRRTPYGAGDAARHHHARREDLGRRARRDRRRGASRCRLARRDLQRAVAESSWRELVYPKGHPFRARPIGDLDVVRSAKADDLREHHRRAIRPDGAVLVVAGGVEAKQVFDAADKAFSSWRAGGARDERQVLDARLTTALRQLDVVPDKPQSDVVLGWPGMPRSDPR